MPLNRLQSQLSDSKTNAALQLNFYGLTKCHAKFVHRFPCGHNYNLLFSPSTLFPALFKEFYPVLWEDHREPALEQEQHVYSRDLKNKTDFLWKKHSGTFNHSLRGAFLFIQNTLPRLETHWHG